jgi:hypothetical protein
LSVPIAYSRAKTWAALYSQHTSACYALVPYSSTNNSIAVICCASPEDTQRTMRALLEVAEACAAFYTKKHTPEKAPAILTKTRHAVVLAKSSDYYHYHLADHPELGLVVCGLHDSYLHLPVWEMRTNQRYIPRETAIPIASEGFDRIRRTAFGHTVLVGALINGDQTALTFLRSLPPRTQRRIRTEVEELQATRYRGRPLAFLTEAERREIGSKISAGLRRYHTQSLQAM